MDQKSLDNLYRTQTRLFKNKSVLELLLEIEGIFEQLGLYVYDNWIEGKIINGPEISKHWIECMITTKCQIRMELYVLHNMTLK